MSSSKMIYIKCEQNPQINHVNILMKDVCEVWCKDTQIKRECENITLFMEKEGMPSRHICSALDLIQTIQKFINNADVEVVVLGDEDLIVTYMPPKPPKKWWQWTKVVVVCLTIFFGSAFAIMTFNQDVSVLSVFGKLNWIATGETNKTNNVLEICYSIGLALGILIFYNHFFPKKMLADPTPLEVEMRQYETDICTTIVADDARKKKAESRKGKK